MPSNEKYELPEYIAYKRRLDALGKDILPRIIAEAVNQVAGFAHVQSIRNIRTDMTLRNQYTERSIRFYKANPKADATKINAITGSVQPYMATQDTGGYRRPKQGKLVPVATLKARGGSKTNVVRKANRAGTVGPNRFIGVPRGIRRAGPSAGGLAPYGVYARNRNNKHLVMIRNISKSRVIIKETKWHRGAMEKYATRKLITAAFVKLAQAEIAKLKST